MAHGGYCSLCGGVKRRGTRNGIPVAQCGRCSQQICAKHVRWDTVASENVCTSCARRFDLKVIAAGGGK